MPDSKRGPASPDDTLCSTVVGRGRADEVSWLVAIFGVPVDGLDNVSEQTDRR